MSKFSGDKLALPIFIIKKLWRRFIEHKTAYMGGQLAYFFILSIFPFLIFTNGIIASLNIPTGIAISSLKPFFPEQIVSLIANYIEYINHESAVTLFSFGILLAIFSASKSVRSLIYAFDLAYGVENPRRFLFNILFSMLYIFLFALLLVACVIMVALGNSFFAALISNFAGPLHFICALSFIRWVIIAIVFFLVLSLVYKFIPSAQVRLIDTLPGTVFSIAAFLLLTFLFSFYVNNIMSPSSLYGSLSAIILLMLWMYFSGIIIVLGAELNKIVSDMKRTRRT